MLKKQPSLHCGDCQSRKKGIFCELEGMALENVSQHKVINTFKKGQTLFVQGNPPYGLYCISKGNIKVTKMGEDGKDAIVRIATDGDILGHRSIFTDQYYNATATAIEDSTVCFIDKKFIMDLVRKEPSVACNLITKLGKDLGASEERIASFYQKNVRERLAELFLLLKKSHGEEITPGKWQLNIKLTREEMASIIGTAPETLIRFVTEFKEEGLIEQEKKTLFITDERRLIEFANLPY